MGGRASRDGDDDGGRREKKKGGGLACVWNEMGWDGMVEGVEGSSGRD